MAQEFRTNGSAAYDIDFAPKHQNTARPLERPERLPEAPVRRQPVKKVKAKAAVSPFALLGSAVVVVLLFLVVFSYVSLYETQTEVAELEDELEVLAEQQAHLNAKYEDSLDLDAVEQRARELGMKEPNPDQIVYVRVDTGDTTEIYSAPQEKNFFVRIYDAFRNAFADALEYFS